MDFNRVAWFTSGLLVGSVLDTSTTLMLIIAWIVVVNEPLPEMFGGCRPQQIIGGFVRLIGSMRRKDDPVKVASDLQIVDIQEIHDPPLEYPQIAAIPAAHEFIDQSSVAQLILKLPATTPNFIPLLQRRVKNT